MGDCRDLKKKKKRVLFDLSLIHRVPSLSLSLLTVSVDKKECHLNKPLCSERMVLNSEQDRDHQAFSADQSRAEHDPEWPCSFFIERMRSADTLRNRHGSKKRGCVCGRKERERCEKSGSDWKRVFIDPLVDEE